MAKSGMKRVTDISIASIAVFEGILFGTLGLVIAVLKQLDGTFEYAQSSQNLLNGLTFGLTGALVVIVLLPIIWFVLGALLGAIHGCIYNYVAKQTGGISITLKDNK